LRLLPLFHPSRTLEVSDACTFVFFSIGSTIAVPLSWSKMRRRKRPVVDAPSGSGRHHSARQQNRAVEEAPLGGSSAVKKSSVPNSLSRGSDGSSGSRMGAEEQVMSEHASNGDAGSSSKKRRKRMDARSYIKKFKTGIRPGASAAVVASPDRMGKENTSSGHVADNNNNAAILCEGSRLIEKSKGHSSHAAFKVSKSPISGLHETSDTRVDQCSTPLLEVQPHKPTDVQNIAAESSLPAKDRDRHTGPARQNIVPSLQSVPISS
uniref:Uncharacterized protein n=1 Tax=Aegilops tauschii subsp. strangulata TaxID=200361 RepID=A0A453MT46_AEGTS